MIGPIIYGSPRTPLSHEAFDGGIFSAEALGRGQTFASNRGNPASGSQNPARLLTADGNAFYSTYLVGINSRNSDKVVNDQDPLSGKTMQYLSLSAEKGAIFFQPVGRQEKSFILTPQTSQNVSFSADAIGFAAAEKWKEASVGLSVSYIYGSLATVHHETGQPDKSKLDTASGFNLGLGFNYPAGPTLWGLSLQNFPGFLFWKHYSHDTLPILARVGNTWRIGQAASLSFDFEERFYNRGSDNESFINIGNEFFISPSLILRAGVFSKKIREPKERHWTGGLSIRTKKKIIFSYAMESFLILNERVNKSFLSVQLPFTTTEEASE